jgi:hypothetical protein
MEYALSKMGCIQTYSFGMVDTFNVLKPPSFNANLLMSEHHTNMNPFYMVEFNSTLSINWDIRTETQFQVLSRVNYDKKRRIARMIVHPLVRSNQCDEQLISDICKCI